MILDLFISKFLFIGLVISSTITSVLVFIGFGIGGTSIGETSVEFYTKVTGAKQEINNELKSAMNEIVEESCKSLDEKGCNELKSTVKTAQTLQEVVDKSNKLKKNYNKIKKLN